MKKNDLKLTEIPGVGPYFHDFTNTGIKNINDLIGKNPEELYELSHNHVEKIQDGCLLYVFRCAVYYTNTPEKEREN